MSPDSEPMPTAPPVVMLSIVPLAPAEVPVGAEIRFHVEARSAAGDDLRGAIVELVAADAVVARHTLMTLSDGHNETDAFAVKAPEQPGAVSRIVRLPAQEIDGTAYAACALPIAFTAAPLRTSLAVWDVPSPVTCGTRFRIKVGAKSAGGCALAGARLEALDEAGAAIGQGVLGNAPLGGTEALYWTEIELDAPPAAGTYAWSVAFAPGVHVLPHVGASTRLGFAAVLPPEHRLTVKVRDENDATPLAGVEIALGPHRATTDTAGSAVLEAPRGSYQLAFWKAMFEAAQMHLDLTFDMGVEIALKRLPEEVKIWG